MKLRAALLPGLWILALVGLSAAPLVYGERTAPPGLHFTGLIGPNGNDQAFYLAWGPRQSYDGHWLYEDKFNGHADRRLVFNPLWLAIGLAARAFEADVTRVFHVQRMLASALCLWIVYRLAASAFACRGARFWTLALASTASGLGWAWRLADLPGRTPDLWIVESNLFMTLLWEINLPIAYALTAFFFLGWKRYYEDGERRWALRIGAAGLLLGAIYPYQIVTLYYGAAAFSALYFWLSPRRPRLGALLRDGLAMTLPAAPVLAWDAYLVLTDDRLTEGQALFPSPLPHWYAVAFGALAVGALAGLAVAWRRRDAAMRFPALWLLVGFTAIYLPVPFQMQLILGIQVPMAILTVYALQALTERAGEARPGRFHLAAAATAAFAAVGSVFQFVWVFDGIDRRTIPEYLTSDERGVADWLDRNAPPSAVVLAPPRISPYIPVYSDAVMFTGDYAAPTAGFARKAEEIRKLVDETRGFSETEALAFLREERIDFVLVGPGLGDAPVEEARARIAELPVMEPVFESGPYALFRVTRDG